jgi:hypothetical protein
MFTVTRFCVQVYERRNRPPEAQEFRDRGAALTVGQLAARRAVGVAVYEVTGWPVQDLWREPQLIASYGVLPD